MTQSKLTEEIKEKLSIEEVVSSYIKLEKSGINMKARCPFHNEKTASFFVSPNRNSYYCFGCAKGGDIFTFVEEIEGVDFIGALKILAEKAGVDIQKHRFEAAEKIDASSYTILEKATIYFEANLNKHADVSLYLKKRGLEEKTIKKFRLGYSLDEWQNLYNFLKKEGYDDNQILASGLVVKNETGRIYDRFRGRIIFPIFDESGKVIAFTARILVDDKNSPKYVNSPETQLFNKSRVLYAFNFAKQTIRKHDFAILMEGQIDVIMSHQIGFTNAIASSGTSFTEDQLKIIKRYTNNLLISFDGDSAGIKSSKKVWELALNNEMDVKVLPLGEGRDPADVILSNPDEWKNLVKQSRHIIEHLADNINKNYLEFRKKQKEVQREIYPYLRSVKTFTDRSYFVDKISAMFGIDKDAIWSDINSNKPNEEFVNSTDVVKSAISPEDILYAVYWLNKIKKPDEYLAVIKKYISEDEVAQIENQKEKILFEVDLIITQYDNFQQMVQDMFTKLKLKYLENHKNELKVKVLNPIEVSEEKVLMREIEKTAQEIERIKKDGCQDLLDVI